MKPFGTPLVQSIKGVEDLARYVTGYITNISKILEGNVSFKDNMRSQVIQNLVFVNGVAQAISHNLGFIPVGFILIKSNVSVNLFNDTGDWNSTTIFLTSDADATCSIIIVGA